MMLVRAQVLKWRCWCWVCMLQSWLQPLKAPDVCFPSASPSVSLFVYVCERTRAWSSFLAPCSGHCTHLSAISLLPLPKTAHHQWAFPPLSSHVTSPDCFTSAVHTHAHQGQSSSVASSTSSCNSSFLCPKITTHPTPQTPARLPTCL